MTFLFQLSEFATQALLTRVLVTVKSSEIARASLHVSIPWYTHLYTLPFLSLYPFLAYSYYVKYEDWLVSEEWTFLACVSLGVGHALSFLITRWNAGARAWITTKKVCAIVHVSPWV
jgi:cation-transporting ATPase 13A1